MQLANTAQNTVIVTVTQVVDVRDANNYNNRYLVNQLLADNGRPESEIVVIVSASEAMTIGLPDGVDLSGFLASATAVSLPTGVPVVGNFDPNAPFGQYNQSVLLPYGSAPPTLPDNAQIFGDPADIILAGHSGFFVEDIRAFSQDCALWGANGGSLFNLASQLVLAEQVAAAQLVGLQIGANLGEAVALGLLHGGQTATETSSAEGAKETGKDENDEEKKKEEEKKEEEKKKEEGDKEGEKKGEQYGEKGW